MIFEPKILSSRRSYADSPGYVKYIAEKIAEVKSLSLEEVANITSKNAEDFFSINRINYKISPII